MVDRSTLRRDRTSIVPKDVGPLPPAIRQPEPDSVIRMLRCTLCETVVSSKTAVARAEVIEFWNAHEKAHAGTVEVTRRSRDGARTIGPLDPADLEG